MGFPAEAQSKLLRACYGVSVYQPAAENMDFSSVSVVDSRFCAGM